MYEGESNLVMNNHKLGELELLNIHQARKGIPTIEVTFDIDANGVLRVSAMDRETGSERKLIIANDKGTLLWFGNLVY